MHPATSTYLEQRPLGASAVVFAVHAYPQRPTGGLPVLYRFGNLGNDAVMVFFVVPGFAIAHVAYERERVPADNAINRLARRYSVVVPAVVADAAGSRLAPALDGANWFATDGPARRIVANLLVVNEPLFTSVRLSSNAALWSLGYELWYSVLFGAPMYLRAGYRVVVFVAAALLVGPKILLLEPVWLLGVANDHRTRAKTLSPPFGALLAVGTVLAYLAFRQLDGPKLFDDVTTQWLGTDAVAALGFSKWSLSSYLIGTLVALHLVGIAAIAPRLVRWLPERPIRDLASFTFALYLFHYPLMDFFAAWFEQTGLSAYRSVFVIPATMGTVWLLGQLTERRKATVWRWPAAGVDAIARSGWRRIASRDGMRR